MNEDLNPGCLVLEGSEPLSLLSHMAFYGLAAILEGDGRDGLRLSWTAGMSPRPVLSGPGLDNDAIGEMVRLHAASRARGSWPSERLSLAGKERGLMSPRVGKIDDWENLQRRRRDTLDRLVDEQALVDLRLVWSLGEPCYWRFDKKEAPLQDDAASRLEMQSRNNGSEVVSQRFAPLAALVAERPAEAITAGLVGTSVSDQLSDNSPNGRSGTGFRGPGPVDDAVAWCALWGISQFPLIQSTRRRATTAGHIGKGDKESFYVPVWAGRLAPSRLRTVLASAQLRAVAAAATSPGGSLAAAGQSVRWLAARGVLAVITFPVARFGSAKAPERRAQQGVVHRLEATR